MKLVDAERILGDIIRHNGTSYHLYNPAATPWICWPCSSPGKVSLEGHFTPLELEAIMTWIRNQEMSHATSFA